MGRKERMSLITIAVDELDDGPTSTHTDTHTVARLALSICQTLFATSWRLGCEWWWWRGFIVLRLKWWPFRDPWFPTTINRIFHNLMLTSLINFTSTEWQRGEGVMRREIFSHLRRLNLSLMWRQCCRRFDFALSTFHPLPLYKINSDAFEWKVKLCENSRLKIAWKMDDGNRPPTAGGHGATVSQVHQPSRTCAQCNCSTSPPM